MPLAAIATGGASDSLRKKRSRSGDIAAGPPNPVDHPDPVIRYSTSSDRSSPTALSSATVSGTIYVHLLNNESEIDQVSFWLDPTVNDATILAHIAAGTDPKTNGHIRNDSTVPYDYNGGTTTANPLDTTTIIDGSHTLKVGVRWIDGDVGLEEVTFTISNGGSFPITPLVVTAACSVGSPTVNNGGSGFEGVTSWTQFFPAGDGVTEQPNAILAGGFKGLPLENVGALQFTDEIQYPAGLAWSSPIKTGPFKAAMVSVSGSPSDAAERWQAQLDAYRVRDIAHPTNGGWGSQTRSPEYGARKILNCVLSRRKHNAKTWAKRQGVWTATNINNGNKENLGYTPGLPNGTTNAEDSAVAYAILLSGGQDAGIVNMANALVDDTSAGLDYGEWVERMFFRGPWECTGPWSSDYTGINPNLIGSTVIADVADGDYGLGLTQQAKDLLDNLISPGDPSYEAHGHTDAYDDYPGWREVEVGTANPDYGTGGDLSVLAGLAYRRFFEVLHNAIIDRCVFRGVPELKPIVGPNFAHPGAAPTSGDAGGEDGPVGEGWAGTGGAPDGGDLYKPHEMSRQLNMRYLDTIGADYMAFIDMDFYGRGSLLSNPDEILEIRSLLEFIALRFGRPIGSSECGFSFDGDKDTATGNTSALAAYFTAIFHPVTGMWAGLPVTHIVHYLPDGDNMGDNRYRLKKSLDNVGSGDSNPWYVMSQYFAGRAADPTAFYGIT